MKFIILLPLIFSLACGSDSSESDDAKANDTDGTDGPIERTGFVAVELGDKYFYLKSGEQLSASCDETADFLMLATYLKCKSVSIDTEIQDIESENDLYDWKISSHDSAVDIEAVNDYEKGTLAIDDKKYYCYYYFDDGIDTKGDEWLVGMTLLLKSPVDTVDDINPKKDLYGFLTSDSDFCSEYIFK